MLLDSLLTRRLASAYLRAKHDVVQAGYEAELEWQEQRRLENVTESEFLRETAWVILSAGMAESVVSARFSRIAAAFLEWESARSITANATECRVRAMAAFRNARKIDAVISAAEVVADNGFDLVLAACIADPLSYLAGFPYIGPVTVNHLAKNLGIDIVKPDRHLMRIAAAAGVADPAELCAAVQLVTGDRLGVIDLVIWRHAVITPGYEAYWREAGGSPDAAGHPLGLRDPRPRVLHPVCRTP
jgi:hypothetical protein